MEHFSLSMPFKDYATDSFFEPCRSFFVFKDLIDDPKLYEGKTLGDIFLSWYGYERLYGELAIRTLNKLYHRYPNKDYFVHVNDKKKDVGFIYLKSVSSKSRGRIFIVPGGGYRDVCGIEEGLETGLLASELGMDVFICSYGTREDAAFPQAGDDIASIIDYVNNHTETYGNNLDYCLCGFSAAGHLCALLSSDKYGLKTYGITPPKALFLLYPVISLEVDTHAMSRDIVLGDKRKDDPYWRKELSANNQVTSHYPPTFLAVGDCDICVPPISSYLMRDALIKEGVKMKYHCYKNLGHGFAYGRFTKADGWLPEALDFAGFPYLD